MKNFSTYINEKLKITKKLLDNQHNGYDYVDLGLPSGTMWSICNLGGDDETDYGIYFQWGDTELKDHEKYSETDNKFINIYNTIEKYNLNDGLEELEPEDDAAHVNMGGKWCIPTIEQFKELKKYTTNEWRHDYNGTGVNGRLFTSKQNGNTIFFPANGLCNKNTKYTQRNDLCAYWTNKLVSQRKIAAFGYTMYKNSFIDAYQTERYLGYGIRPCFIK